MSNPHFGQPRLRHTSNLLRNYSYLCGVTKKEKNMENITAKALRTLLAHNIVSFTFRKVDGEIRHAIGTRCLALAEIHTGITIPTPKGEEQPNSYYDIEKMGWRSYKPENLISIDGVYARKDTDFAKKPTTPNVETKKGELPKREIPIVKPTNGGDLRKPDINAIISGLFGGDTDFIPAPAPKEKRLNDGKIHTPTYQPQGVSLPIDGISIDDFAKLVAKYVVSELADRLRHI